MRRKTISIITILAMMISLFGFNAFNSFSSVVPGFAGGLGTESEPWQIATLDQLEYLRYYLGPGNRGYYFVLTADIDLNVFPYNEGLGWTPIGDWFGNNFQGNFDGLGHTINGLYINNPKQAEWGYYDIYPTGLFGEVEFATIKNLNLTNVNVTGSDCVGGLTGGAGNSNIINVNVTGTVAGNTTIGGVSGYASRSYLSDVHFIGTSSGLDEVGGVAGQLYKSALRNASSAGQVLGDYIAGGLVGSTYECSIFNSHSESTVIGTVVSDNVGGLVGINFRFSTIDRSYATGNVSGEGKIGGLVGYQNSECKVTNSYATGNVSSTNDDIYRIVAGLVGETSMSSITNNYAVGIVSGTGLRHGGLVGYDYPGDSTVSSYALGPDNGYGATVTEEQMKAQSTFVGWDFTNIWGIDEGLSYPYLLPVLTDAEVISVETFSPFKYYIGTPLSDVALPFSVNVTLDDTTTVPLMVVWDGGTPVYDSGTLGDYVFTGILSATEGITNTSNVKASLTITVTPLPKNIIAVEPLSDINIVPGTSWGDIPFPLSVIVTLEDESTVSLPVTWYEDSVPSFDGDTAGTYAFEGTIVTSHSETNTLGIKADVNVVVALPADTPPVITSHPANIDVLVGETASFTVAYTANPNPTFQWQISKNGGKKWTNILGATTAAYDVTQATLSLSGYQYRVILQNGIGDPITSNAGILTVNNGLADLEITQEATYDSAGREIEWHITVTNLGPDTAQGVVIKNPLVSSTKFLNYTGSYEPIFKGKSVIFNVGSIEAYDSVTVSIQVSIIRDAAIIQNTATVTTTSVDEYLINNSYTTEVLQ